MTPEELSNADRFITSFGGGVFHVFGKDYRSLCGRAMMIRVVPENVDHVTGKERYKKGVDCKACFKKAGLDVTP